MPRYPSFPATADDIKRLELSYLLRSNLLRPGFHVTTISWSVRGKPSGRISLEAHIFLDETYLRLRYTLNDTTNYDYRVELEATASNLPGGKGVRYYMICPVSGRRATVLFLRPGSSMFAHRLAYTGTRLFYDSQLEPKRFRGLGSYFAIDRKWEQEYRKGRKTHYQGKPTRWYARLLKLEQRAEAATPMLLQELNK
ncbi:hypothetical protein LRS06_17095 [Hymenobacter sp. J193]|uniref:hypothetical protein n=1 Tax=Hymenobacter sp. J193 TaxID=2898429 RepID=UPI002150D5D3|nr:hypothetical protein [Hymenobacter sp. J193]MCR5889455.1 hypothetical protein [Hymenobacter sp. J193]